MRRAFPFVVAALAGGCAAKTVYLPIDHAGATLPTGQPAARYVIPRDDRPEGAVEVATVQARRLGARREVTVRVRLDNRSGDAWAFDPAAQRLTVDEAPNRPVTFPEETAPLTVPPRMAREVDLHFIVPGETPPTGFRLAWEVLTPLAVVRAHATFRRVAVAAAYRYGPPIAEDGYYYRPFFERLPNRVGFAGPQYTLAPHPPTHGRGVILPAQPPAP